MRRWEENKNVIIENCVRFGPTIEQLKQTKSVSGKVLRNIF